MSVSTESDRLEPGSPASPVEFGDYYLLGLIARGGMAEVYRARSRMAGDAPRLVAIKVMRPALAREPRFVDMFQREGRLAVMLRNPSIVETLEVGRFRGRHFIAMEFLPGRDLNQILRRVQEQGQRIPVPHAVFIAARIAEGLDFAHNLRDDDGRPLNLVNRDVSPSNVRLSYGGEVKLIDFGIAQALMSFSSEIGVLKGKFSYMSPEQIRGLPVDARTDIFSCGIVLHEMLTTEKLFRGDTEFALMEKVRKSEVFPPSRFNRRVTEDLDQVALRALARDPDQRFQSAGEFRDELERVLDAYHFHPRELEEFMRRHFRKEWLAEQEDCEIALRSLPGQGPGADSDPAIEIELAGEETPATPATRTSTTAGSGRRGPTDPDTQETGPSRQEQGGFWARFRRGPRRGSE